jgi:hypothetical protein
MSKSEVRLYLLGEGESIFLAMSAFLPIPIPLLGEFPNEEGML